jgi:hypothetical protein
MKLNEFILKEYYEEEEDEYSYVKIDHTRRPRITLMHLQKLRKARSIEDMEIKQRDSVVSDIYGRSQE